MRQGEVGGVIIGTDLSSSSAGLELARARDFLWAAVGLHPNDNPKEEFDAQAFEELARDPKVVAIGECGLDYFRSGGTPEEKAAQMERFTKHIELAQKTRKALVVHCRNAHEDCSSVLQNTRIATRVPVILHFFTATAEVAQKYLDLGCYLSFPGPITYTGMYDASIKATPLDKILVETDAPFAAPGPHRGKRNEPVYVSEVIKKIAALKGLEERQVAAATVRNAKKAFSLH